MRWLHKERSAEAKTSLIEKTVRELASHPGLLVDELAKACGFGASNLRKLVKNGFGMSPHRLVEMIRLERAVRLMKMGEMKLDEVSRTAGFSSPQSFGNALEKRAGLHPSQLKRIVQHPGNGK